MNAAPNPAIKPCPFCGAATSDYGTVHSDDCYFTMRRRRLKAPDGDLTLMPAVLDAWNRRTGERHSDLLLLAASDLESWMKSYHRDSATEDLVKRLRGAAHGVPEAPRMERVTGTLPNGEPTYRFAKPTADGVSASDDQVSDQNHQGMNR